MLAAVDRAATVKLTFPQWLKLKRSLAGVTQIEIADALGVRPQSVSNWEKGVSVPNINPKQTQQLCRLLNVTLDELVRGFDGDFEIDD